MACNACLNVIICLCQEIQYSRLIMGFDNFLFKIIPQCLDRKNLYQIHTTLAFI